VFDRAARVLTSSILPDHNNNELYPEYATALFKRILDAQATARENLKRSKIRFKRYYNRKTNPQTFEKDQYVYLLKEPSNSKFDEQYIESYKILEILVFRILIDDVFLECSRYDKYKSNTSNKRINGPPILLSKQTKKKQGIVIALPLPSGEEKSQCFARNQRQRSLLLEQGSKIL